MGVLVTDSCASWNIRNSAVDEQNLQKAGERSARLKVTKACMKYCETSASALIKHWQVFNNGLLIMLQILCNAEMLIYFNW